MTLRKNYFAFTILFLVISQFISCSEDELPKEPQITDKVFDLTENSSEGTIVGKVMSDDEQSENLTYQIVGGDPQTAFSVDAETGEIEVNDSEFTNYEDQSIFELAIKVKDTKTNLDGVAQITINILNVMEIPLDGLVARYNFSEGSANDVSGNNNNGVNSDATENMDRLGTADDALLFNSEADFVKVSNPGFLNNSQGTFIAWVKFSNIDHIQYIASVGDEGSIESYISFIRLDPDKQVVGIYQREPGLANWVEGSTPIEAGKYYQFVMQSDGFNWTVYINGVKEELTVRSGSNNGKWIKQLNGLDNFVIGSSIISQPYTIPNFSGVIDEVLLYDRPLEECEIVDLYNDSKP